MVETEKFMITLTIPEYVLRLIDEKKDGLSRSAFIEKTVNKNLNSVRNLLSSSTAKSVSINLSIDTIDKIKEVAEENNTTVGRVIYMALLKEICKEL